MHIVEKSRKYRKVITYSTTAQTKGFPDGASSKEFSCQYRRHKRCGFDPWVGKITWRKRAWESIPVFLPG